MEVRGRDILADLPKTITGSSEEIREALSEAIASILEAIRITLERTPPELSADLISRGLVLAGGGALLRGLDKLISEETGLPVHIAEKLMDERIKEVARGVHPANHFQVIDLARALNVNLINTHTTADNLVKKYVRDYIEKRRPETIGDLIDVLLEIPEYQEAKRRGAGPKLFAGDPSHRVGKFVVEMTGGTNPASKIYEEVSRAGISTTIGMHMRDDSRDKASEHHMNVVIAGHMSSDSLGMNLFLDELEKKGIDIVPCSGLIRISRNKRTAKRKVQPVTKKTASRPKRKVTRKRK